ncbi:formin-binding protein [Basidiobolus ranarum]|uniref:Formin-binding protein n=1 Tax=Basidiobolus ranarum TaxID=34480 RepID=A0ABR2WT86_9FUNG
MTISTPTYANSFWGKNEEGVEVLMTKLRNSKQTFVDFQSLFAARYIIHSLDFFTYIKSSHYLNRSALEEEYGKKLLDLAQVQLGQKEFGNLKSSLEIFRSELQTQANSHLTLSQQIQEELDATIVEFMSSQREKRKVQTVKMEKSARDKAMFRAQIMKLKERWESEKFRIREMEKHPHIEHNPEYHSMVSSYRQLDAQFWDMVGKSEEADAKWANDWRESCNVFQSLEEDRIEFLKKICWDFSNLIAANCVTEDESCENIRVSLEKCNTQADIIQFIQENGTGDEMPEPAYPRGIPSNGKAYETRSDPQQRNDVNPSRPNVESQDPSRSMSSTPQGAFPPGTEQQVAEQPNNYGYDPRDPRSLYYQNGPESGMPYRNYPSPYGLRNGYYPVDPRMAYYGSPAPSPMAYPGRMVDYSGRPTSPTASPHQMAYYPGTPNQRSPWVNYGGNGHPPPLQIDNGLHRQNTVPNQTHLPEVASLPRSKTTNAPEPTHGLGVYQAPAAQQHPSTQPQTQHPSTTAPVQPQSQYSLAEPPVQPPQAHPRPQPRETAPETIRGNEPQVSHIPPPSQPYYPQDQPKVQSTQQVPQSPYDGPYPPGPHSGLANTPISPRNPQPPYDSSHPSVPNQQPEAPPSNYPSSHPREINVSEAQPDTMRRNPSSQSNSYTNGLPPQPSGMPNNQTDMVKNEFGSAAYYENDKANFNSRRDFSTEITPEEFRNLQLDSKQDLANHGRPPLSIDTSTEQPSRGNANGNNKVQTPNSTPIKESRSVFASRSKETMIQESVKPKMSLYSDKPNGRMSSQNSPYSTDPNRPQSSSRTRPKSQAIDHSHAEGMLGQKNSQPSLKEPNNPQHGDSTNGGTLGYSASNKQPDMEVRALYDYDAESNEELSIHEGQVVRVLATHLDGWWEGQIQMEDGSIKRGLFPSNFTEPVINLNFS